MTKCALFAFIILVGLARPCLAQQNRQIPPNQIKISPLRLIENINPGLELSYERIYSTKFSTQIGIGVMKSLLGIKAANDYSGWRYAIEQKYFVGSYVSKRKYWALDAVYLKVNYNDDGIFRQDTAQNTPEYTDTYHINKRTLTFNIKRGIQVPIKHFIIDFSAGIGIKYKMMERSGLEDVNAIESKSRHPNVYEMTNRAGRYLTLSLPVNVRFGYLF